MNFVRTIAAFVFVLAFICQPATASAFVPASPKSRVGAFEDVQAASTGGLGAATSGLHKGIGEAYNEIASGYRFAARGATSAVEGARSPVARLGTPMRVARGRNAPTRIGGRQYTGHALDQMQGRGLTPSVVEDTIANGAHSAGREGARIFRTNQARVILNPDGSVKTVMPFSP